LALHLGKAFGGGKIITRRNHPQHPKWGEKPEDPKHSENIFRFSPGLLSMLPIPLTVGFLWQGAVAPASAGHVQSLPQWLMPASADSVGSFARTLLLALLIQG